jgi:hypothetical protein
MTLCRIVMQRQMQHAAGSRIAALGAPRLSVLAPRRHLCCRAVDKSDRAVLPGGDNAQAIALALGEEAHDHKVLECFATGAEGTCVILDEDTGVVSNDAAILEAAGLLQPATGAASLITSPACWGLGARMLFMPPSEAWECHTAAFCCQPLGCYPCVCFQSSIGS